MLNNVDIEYCNPFNKEDPNFWMKLEHLGRYLYAADIIKKNEVQSVADISCADGYGCIEIAPFTKKVIGVDISAEILDVARVNSAEFTNIEFVQCNIEKESPVHFLNQPVDFITSFETLEHLDDPELALNNFNQFLKENGQILISVPNATFEPKTLEGKPRNPNHKQLFSKKDIIDIIEKAGFKIEKFLGQPYPNIFFNKERTMIKEGIVEQDWVNEQYNHTPETIRFFTRLFSIPSETLKEESYSFIILARK